MERYIKIDDNEALLIYDRIPPIPAHLSCKYGSECLWRARLPKDISNITGKPKETERTGKTLDELWHKIRPLVRPYEHLLGGDISNKPFADVAIEWFESHPEWEYDTKLQNRRLIYDIIIPMTVGMTYNEVNHIFLQEQRKYLMDRNTKDYLVANIFATYRRIFKYGIDAGYSFHNPARGIRVKKPVKTIRSPLSEKQERILIDSYIGHEDENMINLALETGMRPEELVAVMEEDVCLETAVLYVRHAIKRRENPKTGKAEWYLRDYTKNRLIAPVILSDFAVEAIRRELDKKEAIKNSFPDRWNEPIQGLIFEHDHGMFFTPKQIGKRFKKHVSKLGEGFKNITLYNLRHTAATDQYYCSQGDIMLVKEFLRQENINNTVRYTHCRYENKREVAQRRVQMIRGEVEGRIITP